MKCKKCGKEFEFPYLARFPATDVVPYDVLVPICPYCHNRLE